MNSGIKTWHGSLLIVLVLSEAVLVLVLVLVLEGLVSSSTNQASITKMANFRFAIDYFANS
jgi:hypothetical protein